MTSPRCVGELEQIVGGADHRPLRSDLVEAAQEELAKAAGMFDLAEQRFDDLLSQAVAAAPAGALELSPWRPCAILWASVADRRHASGYGVPGREPDKRRSGGERDGRSCSRRSGATNRPSAASIEQQSHHHGRMARRVAPLLTVNREDRTKIQVLPHPCRVRNAPRARPEPTHAPTAAKATAARHPKDERFCSWHNMNQTRRSSSSKTRLRGQAPRGRSRASWAPAGCTTGVGPSDYLDKSWHRAAHRSLILPTFLRRQSTVISASQSTRDPLDVRLG